MEKEEITSLNHKLFLDFTIQELEHRFETDPLLLSNLFSIGELFCGNNRINCPSLQCGCNGGYDGSCACKKISECPILQCGCDSEYK